MRESVSTWLFPVLSRLAKKNKYDLDKLMHLVTLIDGSLPLPRVRALLNEHLEHHHYELVGVLAEFMVRDDRVSFQKAGQTFLRKVAKAPATSESMLRMLDRAKQGMRLYRARVVVENPWCDSVETVIVKIYAVSEADALAKAHEAGASRALGAQILDVKVREITSDVDEFEMDKAEVESIVLSHDDGATEERAATFAAASDILRSWQRQLNPGAAMRVNVAVRWENGEFCAIHTEISRAISHSVLDVSMMLKSTIALILDNVSLPGKTQAHSQSLRDAWRAQGATAHLTQVQAECLLRDWHPVAGEPDGGA